MKLLNQTIDDNGLHRKQIIQIYVPLKLDQKSDTVEINAVTTWKTWSMIERENMIRRDDTYRKPQVERSQHTGLIRRQAPSQRCERRPLTVNFRDIGWLWINSPKQFNAYVCEGICSNPLIGSNITLHAQIQAKLHAMKPNVINNPCCVATRLSSLDVYYYVGRNKKNITLHEMVVEECDCR
ncbi:hypothetical protein CHS0354_020731 [Potamilus streckersoni]|uniref:TGF-beta family profile domain-containing protein n=1 Tax=Potamilus streckersoni TaxID=2493646 RepID=A0AAE0SU54_9BIVA|nr:hypothetical protein CHS0354_020731 [Potamilus streckersoni]